MDGTQFDAWTSAMTRNSPRRGAVKVLVATVCAGLGLRGALRGTAACTDTEGEPCDPMMGCCDGLACSGGICVLVGSRSCPSVNQSNQCVSAPTCEGNGCKKKKKKGRKKHRR
jgi:hypothetical protein